MVKVGRNEQCPCGSGKKHKKCCGLTRRAVPPDVIEAMDLARRHREAEEKIRTREQGFGRGIVQFDAPEGRIVAVGSTVYSSTKWHFFTDFLLDYLRGKLGEVPPQHPVRSWFEKMVRERQLISQRDDSVAGTVRSGVYAGYIASFFYLAYSLYLLEHHDQIPPSLLRRLRQPRSALPAVYETFVGAAFALSGHAIRAEEVRATDAKQGEFTATSSKTGTLYSVEAKRREAWRTPYSHPMSADFASELRQYVRTRVGKAARKGLPNPVYWLELSIAGMRTRDEFMRVRREVQSALREAENNLLIGDQPPEPAYVFVTNHGHLASDSLDECAVFTALEAFRMPSFLTEGAHDLERALESYDAHRDMISVIDCLGKVKRVPMAFDGTPDELMGRDGQPVTPPKLGDRMELPLSDGTTTIGVLEEITAAGDTAWIVLREDVSGRRMIGQFPLKPEEALAVKTHGDAIFGKENGGSKLPEGDHFAFYDWLLEVQANHPRNALLTQLKSHSRFGEFENLSTAELRIRVARELVKGAAQSRQRITASPGQPTDS